MKKKLDLVQIAAAIAIIVALLWFFLPSKTFDELVPLSGEVSVTATYWHTDNSYSIAKWEAGSHKAEKVLKNLRSVTYSKNPVYYLTYRLRRVGNTLFGNTGALTLELRDTDGHKHLVGVQYGQFGGDASLPEFLPHSRIQRSFERIKVILFNNRIRFIILHYSLSFSKTKRFLIVIGHLSVLQ